MTANDIPPVITIRSCDFKTNRSGSDTKDYLVHTLKVLLPLLTPEEIGELQSKDFCSSILKLNFPLLITDSFKVLDEKGHQRYYPDTIYSENVQQKFYICNHWYAKQFSCWGRYLMNLATSSPPLKKKDPDKQIDDAVEQTTDIRTIASMFKKVDYENLNSRQQENYNFQKFSAIFAEYGFNCIRLSDDWQGADFIAIHVDGGFLKIQLKGRLTFDKKYQDKDIWISFFYDGNRYLFPHDEVLYKFIEEIKDTVSWKKKGNYHYPKLSKKHKIILAPFLIY
jgi:hypothetical protein